MMNRDIVNAKSTFSINQRNAGTLMFLFGT